MKRDLFRGPAALAAIAPSLRVERARHTGCTRSGAASRCATRGD